MQIPSLTWAFVNTLEAGQQVVLLRVGTVKKLKFREGQVLDQHHTAEPGSDDRQAHLTPQ